jgi:hypothetical protein
MSELNLCPLCKRELDETADLHHLIPKTFKGKETVLIHKVCHRKLHTVFSERDMMHYYHTIDRLLENEDVVNFVKWLQNKPIDFYVGSDDTNERKRKRRR